MLLCCRGELCSPVRLLFAAQAENLVSHIFILCCWRSFAIAQDDKLGFVGVSTERAKCISCVGVGEIPLRTKYNVFDPHNPQFIQNSIREDWRKLLCQVNLRFAPRHTRLFADAKARENLIHHRFGGFFAREHV